MSRAAGQTWETHGGVRCPTCNGKSVVKDSRPAFEGKMVRRRRHCLKCKHKFSTYERIVETEPDRSLVMRIQHAAAAASELLKRLGEMQMILEEISEERGDAPRSAP